MPRLGAQAVRAGCIIEEIETYKPAEAVLEALHIEIAVTASWMCGGWKEPCAEAVLAPLQDAELFIPVRVRHLNELWRNSHRQTSALTQRLRFAEEHATGTRMAAAKMSEEFCGASGLYERYRGKDRLGSPLRWSTGTLCGS